MRSAADLLDAIAAVREAEQLRQRAQRRHEATRSKTAHAALIDAQIAETRAIKRLEEAAQ